MGFVDGSARDCLVPAGTARNSPRVLRLSLFSSVFMMSACSSVAMDCPQSVVHINSSIVLRATYSSVILCAVSPYLLKPRCSALIAVAIALL